MIFIVGVVVMAHDVRLELVLKDFGYMVDRGIEHRDRFSLAPEQVDDCRHQVASLSHDCGARFNVHLQTMTRTQEPGRFDEQIGPLPLIKQITAPQVNPFHMREQVAQLFVQVNDSTIERLEVTRVAIGVKL